MAIWYGKRACETNADAQELPVRKLERRFSRLLNGNDNDLSEVCEAEVNLSKRRTELPRLRLTRVSNHPCAGCFVLPLASRFALSASLIHRPTPPWEAARTSGNRKLSPTSSHLHSFSTVIVLVNGKEQCTDSQLCRCIQHSAFSSFIDGGLSQQSDANV